MTREYGNYEKYEDGKNQVKLETEKGQDDIGDDQLWRKEREMRMRLKTEEGKIARDEEAE